MKRIRDIGMLAFLLGPGLCFSQTTLSPGFWNFRSFSGEVDLRGQYRQLKSQFKEVHEDQRSTYILGGIKLNTSSYLWDEDILLIDLNGAYSPESRDEKYITVPDRSEVRTLKKVDLRATLFNNKPVTLQGFFNFDQNYYNREALTNVRSNNMQWGSILSLNNRILPLTITYRNQNWDQEETQTARRFIMEQDNLQVRASKSFGSRDRSELTYAHNNYLYNYAGLHQTHHQSDRFALNNNVYLDAGRRYNLNSRITWYDQEGSTTFKRVEVLEGLSLQLPYHLKMRAIIDLYQLQDPIQTWDQRRGRASLQHKLFQSLTSKVWFEYAKVKQKALSLHEETDIRGGADLQYSKKIPTGHLNLAFRYFRHGHSTEGVTGFLQVINEEQVLIDGELTLLKKPYVEANSVMVKDVTGTIVYQLNFDYILIERASYVEIQRVPGGMIPNNSEILVDYTFRQPGSFSYGANNKHFSASVVLLHRLLEFYYRYAVQDYPKVVQGDMLTLNHYSQHVYGIRMDVKFARAGVEADAYNSNIIPYRMKRYYLDMNWNYKSLLLLTLNGSVRDYRMIADEEDQLYVNISGKVAYRIRPNMRVSVESGYLNQRGMNIDLDLLTARAEFHSAFNKLHVRVGVEMYRRMYLNSDFAFNGAYVQLTRKF